MIQSWKRNQVCTNVCSNNYIVGFRQTTIIQTAALVYQVGEGDSQCYGAVWPTESSLVSQLYFFYKQKCDWLVRS